MDKNSFLKFFTNIFSFNRFVRHKSSFYYNADGVTLVFSFQKSNYGPYFYLEYGLAFHEINPCLPFPKSNELDVNFGRIMPSFGKALYYESMGENECNELAAVIQDKIDQIQPIVDEGKEHIVRQLFYPTPVKISYVLNGTPEFLGISKEYFKEHHISIVDF